MKKIIKLLHKIFKRTLGIYYCSDSGQKVGTVIYKVYIKDVFVKTTDLETADTLKKDGYVIIHGVDKYDCYELKRSIW